MQIVGRTQRKENQVSFGFISEICSEPENLRYEVCPFSGETEDLMPEFVEAFESLSALNPIVIGDGQRTNLIMA